VTCPATEIPLVRRRSPPEDILCLPELLRARQWAELTDRLPALILDLDENRQLVFGNAALAAGWDWTARRLCSGSGRERSSAASTPWTPLDGCGTTKFCAQCGAARLGLLRKDGNDTRQGVLLDVLLSSLPAGLTARAD